MVNKNYIKGRAKEYRVKKVLERKGWIVLRTAGSHGFADLVAINKDQQCIRFIQCKPDRYSKSEVDKLLQEHNYYNEGIVWESTFEVI